MLNCDVRWPNLTRMTAYHRRCNRQRNNWYVRWEVYRWVIDWIYPVNETLLTADKACLSTRSRLSVSPIVYCLSKMLYLWYFACSRFDFKIRQNFSLDLKIDVHASNTWIEFYLGEILKDTKSLTYEIFPLRTYVGKIHI